MTHHVLNDVRALSIETRIAGFAARALHERTFELTVAPALADLQFAGDTGTTAGRVRGIYSLLAAFAGGIATDLARSTSLPTFALLVLIPACYYGFLFLLMLPAGVSSLTGAEALMFVTALGALAIMPAVICFWPAPADPPSPRPR